MPDYICISVPHFIGMHIPERTETLLLKESGIAQELGAEWVDITPDFQSSAVSVIAVNLALAETIRQNPNHIPIVFAGDCVSSIGMLKGLGMDHPGMVWYDAHGDFNTPETTPSGFLGGMPLAMLTGRGDMHIMEGVGLQPLRESDIVMTDARDLDPEEGEALAASDIRHLSDLQELLHTPLPNKPLYIHMDTDVVNPDEMPGMSYAAPGGPSVELTAQSLKRVAKDGQIAGILFSLWNETLADDQQPLEATLQLVRAFAEGMEA